MQIAGCYTLICALALQLSVGIASVGAEEADNKSEAADAVAERPQGPVFNIWEFQVEGNTLLDRQQIERTVYPFLGPARSIAEVESARTALESLYKHHGFATVVVDIPEQEVDRGIVRLQITQGKVDRVRIVGSRYFSLGKIRKALPELSKGEVPNIPEFQRQLQAMNQATPDRSVTPIFRPGRTPGTVEVELRVKDELPLHADFELNNRDSIDTKPLRASASFRYANLWQAGHSASLLFSTAPQNTSDSRVFSATYVAPFGSDNVLALYYVNSDSDVATAGTLGVIGKGNISGVRWINVLQAERSYFHSFTLGADYKDFDESVAPVDSLEVPTKIDYMNWLGEYRGTLLGEKSRTTFSFSTNFGIRGLFNSQSEFEDKRFNAKANYLYAGLSLEHTRGLIYASELFLSLNGQIADSPLVSNEQFSAGGVSSVRGYYESQVLGDSALNVSLELRSPSLKRYLWDSAGKTYVLGFFDGAKLRVEDALPGQESRLKLYGAGFGLRFEDSHGFEAALDWAWPLVDERDVDKHDPRAHFRIHYGF